MSRLDKLETFMKMALILAEQSTCSRRKVGCILLDKRHHIIGSGYNGSAIGRPHCIDNPCAGANMASGTGLDKCEAIHAEQNALMQCKNIHEIDVAICTAYPCTHCLKMLMNTSCRLIVYSETYAGFTDNSALWRESSELRNSIRR